MTNFFYVDDAVYLLQPQPQLLRSIVIEVVTEGAIIILHSPNTVDYLVA
jgi:hypothetical protein